MQLRIGVLGLALVSAFVAGSVAQPPAYYTAPDQSAPNNGGLESQDSVDTPRQAPEVSELLSMTRNASESAPQLGSAGQLIGFSGFDGSGSQTITLVHAGKMQIAVYHIDRSGQIRLVSSRPIDADFSLSLNVTDPLPGQIRLLGGKVK
jgi:hypothetical protein